MNRPGRSPSWGRCSTARAGLRARSSRSSGSWGQVLTGPPRGLSADKTKGGAQGTETAFLAPRTPLRQVDALFPINSVQFRDVSVMPASVPLSPPGSKYCSVTRSCARSDPPSLDPRPSSNQSTLHSNHEDFPAACPWPRPVLVAAAQVTYRHRAIRLHRPRTPPERQRGDRLDQRVDHPERRRERDRHLRSLGQPRHDLPGRRRELRRPGRRVLRGGAGPGPDRPLERRGQRLLRRGLLHDLDLVPHRDVPAVRERLLRRPSALQHPGPEQRAAPPGSP